MFFLPVLCQQDGWNQNHFITPVSTLERDRFKSQPTLPTSTIQMSPVSHPGRFLCLYTLKTMSGKTGKVLEFKVGLFFCFFSLFAAASATSSPAMLGIKEHRDTIRDYQRAQSTMQFYNYQGDGSDPKKQYTGARLKV